MLNAVLNNLIDIGWAMLIFLAAYLANVAFPCITTFGFCFSPSTKKRLSIPP